MSQSSRERKERMGATTTGNKPDLRCRLFLHDDDDQGKEDNNDYVDDDSDGDDYLESDYEESEDDEGDEGDEDDEDDEDEDDEEKEELSELDIELVFAEFSQLDAPKAKHVSDWKKLLRQSKDGHYRLSKVMLNGRDTSCDGAKEVSKALNDMPCVALLGTRDKVVVSVVDTFCGGFYRAYDLFELTIPLRVSDRKVVETLLKNALTLRKYFRDVISRVAELKTKSMHLPLAPHSNRPQTPENQMVQGLLTTYTPL